MQQLEGFADRTAEPVVDVPQGLPVADNKRVGLVKAQELGQSADGSKAEGRLEEHKQASHTRSTVVDMRVHGNGDVS